MIPRLRNDAARRWLLVAAAFCGCAKGAALDRAAREGSHDAGARDGGRTDGQAGAHDGSGAHDLTDAARGADAATDSGGALDASADAPAPPPPDAGPPDAPPPDAPACVEDLVELLANGDFDAGDTGWTKLGFADIRERFDGGSVSADSGDYFADLSGLPGGEPTIWQSISVPAGATGLDLSFVYTMDGLPGGTLYVEILTSGGVLISTVATLTSGSSGWTPSSPSLPGVWTGETIRLRFRADIGLNAFYVDTVSLAATVCP